MSIKNKIYPAIIPQTSSSVVGILKKVPKKDLAALDEFEGEEYERKLLEIQVSDTFIQAWTYVWIKSQEDLIMKDWDLNEFLKHQKQWQENT